MLQASLALSLETLWVTLRAPCVLEVSLTWRFSQPQAANIWNLRKMNSSENLQIVERQAPIHCIFDDLKCHSQSHPIALIPFSFPPLHLGYDLRDIRQRGRTGHNITRHLAGCRFNYGNFTVHTSWLMFWPSTATRNDQDSGSEHECCSLALLLKTENAESCVAKLNSAKAVKKGWWKLSVLANLLEIFIDDSNCLSASVI